MLAGPRLPDGATASNGVIVDTVCWLPDQRASLSCCTRIRICSLPTPLGLLAGHIGDLDGPLSGHGTDEGSFGYTFAVVQRSGPYITTSIHAQLMLTSQRCNLDVVTGSLRADGRSGRRVGQSSVSVSLSLSLCVCVWVSGANSQSWGCR